MKTGAKISLILILILALATVGTVAAQEGLPTADPTPTETPTPCTTETVSGTVVAVDESTGTVTVETDTGLCTVTLGDLSGEHPITALLGNYFNDISAESLLEALDTTEVCAEEVVLDGTPTWQIVDCGEDPPNAKVISVDLEAGTVTLEVQVDEQTTESVTINVDQETAESMQKALEALMVSIDEDGTVHQMSDEITRLREEEKLGYGVIVKFLSMVKDAQEACNENSSAETTPTNGEGTSDSGDPCDVTLQGLVDEFKGGKGIGQMFQDYGKPSKLGVGHVRQEMKNGDDGDNGDTGPTTTLNGQGKSNKPETPPGLAKKQDTGPSTTAQEKSTGKGNNGRGNGKAKGKP